MGKRRYKPYTRSAWEIRRERLRIDEPAPTPEDMQLRRLSDILPSLLKRFGLKADLWMQTLEEEWQEIVGPGVAAHTRPGRVADGQLTVYVDSSVWLYELSRTPPAIILENIAKQYGRGKVARLRFQLDPG